MQKLNTEELKHIYTFLELINDYSLLIYWKLYTKDEPELKKMIEECGTIYNNMKKIIEERIGKLDEIIN